MGRTEKDITDRTNTARVGVDTDECLAAKEMHVGEIH